MKKHVVKQRPIVVFNRDFTDEDFGIIPEDFEGDVVVNGNFQCSSALNFNGNLWILGNLHIASIAYSKVPNILEYIMNGTLASTAVGNMDYYYKDIEVKGDCFCAGYINVSNIIVRGDLICGDFIDATDIVVQGDLNCEGCVEARNIIAGGDLICNSSIEAWEVTVNKNMFFKGEAYIRKLIKKDS